MPSTAHGRMRAVAAAFVRGHVVAAVATTTTLALVGRSSGDDGHRDPEEAGSGRSYLEAAGSGRIDPGGSDEWTADVRAAATTAWDNSKRRCRRQQPLVWVATDKNMGVPKLEVRLVFGKVFFIQNGKDNLDEDEDEEAMVRTGSMNNDFPDSATAELPAVEEALSPRSERQKIHLYLAEHTFDDLREGFTAMLNGFRDPPKDVGQRSAKLAQSSKPCPRELDTQSSQKSRQVSESISSATEDLSCHKLSTEEIIQNGKRWMSEEVMLAFKKYIKGRDEFMDVACTLDELQHQCFSVNAYHEVFHHYNFTVKLKKPTSEDTLTYFAEVKQVYGEKIYLCCPLKPNDNGYCHACVNQGMNALKHPPNDDVGFEIGHFNTGFPFMYLSDDDSDGVWVPAENDMDLAMVRTGSMNNDFPDSATAELPAVEEALSPRSERQKIHLYLAEHTFDDLREGFTAMLNGFRDPPKDVGQRSAKLAQSSKPCPRELDTQSSQKSRQVSESISSATEDLSCHKLSTEEIIQNGKRWMSEEVMLAFKKYIKGRDEFMDVACTLDELQHQCFSVNAYHEVFHHYNFTVKLKKPTSEDTLTYFAEVKQVYGEKIYLCCPLKPNDNGYCHACVNQGMNALKHPPNDDVGFEIGHFNTGFPFMYLSDDDSDGVWVPAENDMDLFDSVFD
uniref:DUF3615 domain-containing protein n=1 Tax=Leersia perrieri TaxID=77586 RepID=A0A0D9XUT0_9ORYZ